MAYSIQNIKSNLTGGGARSALFKVTFDYPAGISATSGEKLQFLCKASQIPASTINKLEVRRTEVINHLVIFLQKHWRGTLQRIRYKKMIASLKIMAFYRKYKLRAYMKDLDVRFRNVRQMEDRGKSISWGSPPKSIIATVDYFKLVFRRWQAHFVLISYPKEIHPDIKLRYV